MGTNPYADYQDPMARAGLGQYAGYRDSSHTAGSSVVVDKGCQIINGWWENDKDEKITLSQEGSNVRMVVTTSNIEDGAKVEFTIYKSIYLSSDNVIGTYSTTVSKNKASKLITLIEDKVVKEDNLAEKATDNNAMIEELYFKVKITHKNGVDEKTLPMMKSKYLQVVKQAVLVSVFVEFPVHANLKEKYTSSNPKDAVLQDMGLSGHSAIAIDGEYYDYGPAGSALESPGIPWWDLQSHPGAKTISDLNNKDANIVRSLMKVPSSSDDKIVQNIRQQMLANPNIASDILGDPSQTVKETQILVTKSQAKKIKTWWDNKYNNLGTYSLKPWKGQHCTSTVMESLERAGVIGTGIMGTISYETEIADPEEFYEHFLENLTHQAGYLTNGKIPKDLTLPPPAKSSIAAPNKHAIVIKVR